MGSDATRLAKGMVRHLRTLAWSTVLVLVLSGIGDADPAKVANSVLLVFEGNRLSVRQPAPVPYSEVSRMMTALQRASPIGRYAIVLFRDSPREIIGYLLTVDRDGTLSLGSQSHEWDAAGRQYRLVRSELFRSYQPLDENQPWTWVVSIPINRELQASLIIRAVGARWPIESVSISVAAQPTN